MSALVHGLRAANMDVGGLWLLFVVALLGAASAIYCTSVAPGPAWVAWAAVWLAVCTALAVVSSLLLAVSS